MSTTPGRRRSPLPTVQRLPRVGKIRSGHMVTGKRGDGSEYTRPDRLDHFIMKEDESGITSALVATSFHDVYGPEPKLLRIMLAGRTTDEVLQGAYRQYARGGDGGGRMIVQCDRSPWLELDAEAQCDYRRKADGGWSLGEPCVCQAKGLTGDNACSYSATLLMFLPDVPHATGIVEYETGSVISVRRMTEFLAYCELVRGAGNLLYTEVDLALVPVTVTPATLGGRSSTVYVLQPSLVIPEQASLEAPVTTFRGLLENSAQAPALPALGQAQGEVPDGGYLALPAPSADEVGDPLLHESAREADRARVLGEQNAALPEAPQRVTPEGEDADGQGTLGGEPEPPFTPDPPAKPPEQPAEPAVVPLVQAVSSVLAETPEAGKEIIRQALRLAGRERLTARAVADVLGEDARAKPVDTARAYIAAHEADSGATAPAGDPEPAAAPAADPSDIDALALALGLEEAAYACFLAAAVEYLAVEVQGEGTEALAAAIKAEWSAEGVWDGEAAVSELSNALDGDADFDTLVDQYAAHYGVTLPSADGEPPEAQALPSVEDVTAQLVKLPMAAKIKLRQLAQDAGGSPHPDKLIETFGARAGNLVQLVADGLKAQEAGGFQQWLDGGGGQQPEGFGTQQQGQLA